MSEMSWPERIGLHRFGVIAEATNWRLSPAERGRIVRVIAARTHLHPDGSQRRYARGTIDRWVRAYRTDGLEGLTPQPRADAGAVRAHPELLSEAAALRIEVPTRSSTQIAEILFARHHVWVSERTIRAHLARQRLSRKVLTAEPVEVFGRYEADRPNERWICDVLTCGWVPYPQIVGSARAKLFLIVDDHSRLIVHGRWSAAENTRAGQTVLRQALLRRGMPEALYVDNGAPFQNAALERTCAVLGIRLLHSRPYRPQGRGKQERANRYIRERFWAEAEAGPDGIGDFDWLNDRFTAWVEQVANQRIHAETNQSPIERWRAGGPHRAVDHRLLADAFRWSEQRVVTKTATVSLLGNRYSVDPSLVGRRVELRFDPEDLTVIDVYLDGEAAGQAAPFQVGRHVHPAVPQAQRPAAQPAEPTGVDYLAMVLDAHDEATTGVGVSFRDIPLPGIGSDDHTPPNDDGIDTDNETPSNDAGSHDDQEQSA